jgi:beta-glucuronidase
MPSPLPYPHFPSRKVQLLDGVWDFTFLGPLKNPRAFDIAGAEYDTRVSVPCCFDTLPAYAGKRGTALFRTHVHSTPGTRGMLRFGAIGQWARIFVDGLPVGQCALPYSGFSVEVAPSDRAVREIVILVDNQWSDDRSPLHLPFYDFYAYGGIFRSVAWHELPEVYLDRAQVTTLDPVSGRVRVRVRLAGLSNTATIPEVEVRVDGGDVKTLRDVPCENGSFSFEGSIKNPQPWSPETPELHTIAVSYNGDTIVERFGLRTVEVKGRDILLNGKPVRLLGYNRHEAHPQFGPALPQAQLVHDLQILKDLGCNFVRGSHYPQDQRFLDLCDELGFLVWEESLAWGNRKAQFEHAEFHHLQVEQTVLMVKNSFNHPSVIMWGFMNEGESNAAHSRQLYADLTSVIRQKDPSRPLTYATMFPKDDLHFDLADILSFNTYPGWYAADRDEVRPLDEIPAKLAETLASFDERGFGDKPVIISEIGAGAIYGWRDPLHAHWSEQYQRDYLDVVCEVVLKEPRFNGLALWQFCDGRTYSSAYALGRPRAFNNKGTLDEYRRPKMAYEAVKKRFTEYWASKRSE